jgi:hypothetical protein
MIDTRGKGLARRRAYMRRARGLIPSMYQDADLESLALDIVLTTS